MLKGRLVMLKKMICLFLVSCFLLAGCTRATDDVYSEYQEVKWVSDPNYVPDETESNPGFEISPDFNSGTSSENSGTTSEIPESKPQPKVLYVKDFGAKADGKTDDGFALLSACMALQNCPEGSELVFESNKTYFVSDMKGATDAALYLQELNNVTIKGDNTTILLGKDKRYMAMNSCKNVTVQGFNFDLKERSHFVGTVEEVNAAECYFDVVSDRDFGFYDEFTPEKEIFGLTDVGATSRQYIVIKKLSTLNKESLRYRIYGNANDALLGTGGHVGALKKGDNVILPVPYIGHYGADMINIHGNENLSFKNINVWNSREFVWVLRKNKGEVTFENVNVMPPKDESVAFSSWRDCFHCKENSAAITWNNCTIKGNGDDMFNLSSSMMYVDKVISSNEVVCYWPETRGGSYGSVDPGTTIVIWDADTGELIGKTKLKKVVDEKSNRYVFTNKLSRLKAGENIKFCFDSLSTPNSKIVNCNLDGTMRFRGGPVTIEDCNIRMITLWMGWENMEGPISHDIAFNNCKFNVVGGTATFRLSANNPIVKWREGLYRFENISFNNCTGLKKEYFQNQLVFREDSTDYIKFTPALTE